MGSSRALLCNLALLGPTVAFARRQSAARKITRLTQDREGGEPAHDDPIHERAVQVCAEHRAIPRVSRPQGIGSPWVLRDVRRDPPWSAADRKSPAARLRPVRRWRSGAGAAASSCRTQIGVSRNPAIIAVLVVPNRCVAVRATKRGCAMPRRKLPGETGESGACRVESHCWL